tara:strand:+ start:1795 stop:2079 length:285 start_codon:yes stop_codon:yes gene_type:complete
MKMPGMQHVEVEVSNDDIARYLRSYTIKTLLGKCIDTERFMVKDGQWWENSNPEESSSKWYRSSELGSYELDVWKAFEVMDEFIRHGAPGIHPR